MKSIRNIVRILRRLKKKWCVIHNNFKIKRAARRTPLKIVVGAAGSCDQGWTATDIENLNLLNPRDWQNLFEENSIDAILAEHVWEHISLEEGLVAARQCYSYLKPGGYLRIAVPDGNHPDPSYIKRVEVGADDHRVLFDNKSITELFESAGFDVQLLEYFDGQQNFNYTEWQAENGMIKRSRRFDSRNSDNQLNYTSIIIDAVKKC